MNISPKKIFFSKVLIKKRHSMTIFFFYTGTVELTLYSEMKVKLDLFEFLPKVKDFYSYNADDCQAEINTTPRAFAGVYYPSNGDCEVYLHNPTVIYHVRIQMENHTNAMSFVKAKGHEGKQTII